MKRIFCCPALELFHCLTLWKTVLFVSSRAFSLSTSTFLSGYLEKSYKMQQTKILIRMQIFLKPIGLSKDNLIIKNSSNYTVSLTFKLYRPSPNLPSFFCCGKIVINVVPPTFTNIPGFPLDQFSILATVYVLSVQYHTVELLYQNIRYGNWHISKLRT